jgi:hypothetical protein
MPVFGREINHRFCKIIRCKTYGYLICVAVDARPRTYYYVAVDAKTISILIVAIDASCGLLICMSCG